MEVDLSTEDFNLNTCMMVLKDHDIEGIKISFDGSGDSGDINDPEFFTAQGDEIDISSISNNEQIMELVSSIVERLVGEVGDWYNDEGGYGEVSINVTTGEYETEYHERIESTNDYEFQGRLEDFTEDGT